MFCEFRRDFLDSLIQIAYNSARMKKILLTLILVFSFNASPALATVGGPIYVPAIAFSKVENSVYYLRDDHGGRGCPPIIVKLDLATNTEKEVKSCEEVFNSYDENNTYTGAYVKFIHETFKGLEYLGRVSLLSNKINVSFNFVSEEKPDGELYWTSFKAIVSQNQKIKTQFNIRGCEKNQEFINEGYIIPDSNSLVLLTSRIGDCFEGGYVYEEVNLVKDIDTTYFDYNIIGLRNQLPEIKENIPTTSPTPTPTPTVNITPLTPQVSKNNLVYIIVGFVGVFALGFVAGKKLFRN